MALGASIPVRTVSRGVNLFLITGTAWISPVVAQVIEVHVADSRSRAPVPSAIVALQRTEGGAVLRRLTDLQGRVVFESMGLGVFRITVTGIGYARIEGDPVTVQSRADSARRRVRLSPIAIVLPEVEASAIDACSGYAMAGVRGGALARVLEEAQKGLDITVLTEETVRPWIERWTWEGALDQVGKSPHTRADSVVYTRDPPFATADPGQLIQEGFAQGRGGAGLNFYGPDARVLLDERFLAGHCFWLDLTSRREEGLAGLHFRPQWTRTVPEVEGTLWVQQGDWAPVQLRYTYLNLPEPYGTGPRFGGELRFREVGIGRIVSEWMIYSPLFTTWRTKFSLGQGTGTTPETTQLRGWKVTGGKARALADGLTGGAGSFLGGVARGPGTGLSSLRVCREVARSEPGLGTIVLEVVKEHSHVPAAGVLVHVVVGDPDEQRVDVGGREIRITREVTAVSDTTDNLGRLAVCDVPPGTRYVVQAGVRGVPPVVGQVTAPVDTVQVLYHAEQGATRTAVGGMRGRVVDSAGVSVPGAQVVVPVVGRFATTDTKGRFRLGGVPRGRLEVVVRRVGYVPARFFHEFRQDTTVAEVQLMAMPVALPEVEVRALGPAAVPARLRDWARRREYNGGGKFWDDSLLRTKEHQQLPELLQGIPAMRIIRANGARYAASARGSGGGKPADPRIPRACYLEVYLDGAKPSSSYTPPNLDDIPVHQIMAMELYRSQVEVPIELAGPKSGCGVLAIWTR